MISGLSPGEFLPFSPKKPIPSPFCAHDNLVHLCDTDLVPSVLTEKAEFAVCNQNPGERYRISSPIIGIMEVGLSREQKARKKEALHKIQKNSFEDYLLSEKELESNNYPLKNTENFWISSENFHASSKKYDIVALDCEMCFTEAGLEVTRLSIVDKNCKLIYDEFVMPGNPIVDYNTRFSGITEDIMKNVKNTLADVHAQLSTIFSSETIFVGHSLENDLNALKICHQRVIDTALIYHASSGPPYKPSLKYLAMKYLNETIQSDDSGHNSVVDATICMKLVQMKLAKGHAFGLNVTETEGLCARLERNNVRSIFIDSSKNVSNYGRGASVKFMAESDEDTIDKLCEYLKQEKKTSPQGTQNTISEVSKGYLREYRFAFARLGCLQKAKDAQEAESNRTAMCDQKISVSEERDVGISSKLKSKKDEILSVKDARKNIQTYLKNIYEAAAPSSVIVILSGTTLPSSTKHLQRERQEYYNLVQKYGAASVHKACTDKVFGPDKALELEKEIALARIGAGLLSLTPGIYSK